MPVTAETWKSPLYRRRQEIAQRKATKKRWSIGGDLRRNHSKAIRRAWKEGHYAHRVSRLSKSGRLARGKAGKKALDSLWRLKSFRKKVSKTVSKSNKRRWENWDYRRKMHRALSHSRKCKNGHCDICGKRCKLQRDHDHETGKRRGNLCNRHNLGLGLFGDSGELLRKAIRYLDKWKI